jgi:hypothetical protein
MGDVQCCPILSNTPWGIVALEGAGSSPVGHPPHSCKCTNEEKPPATEPGLWQQQGPATSLW